MFDFKIAMDFPHQPGAGRDSPPAPARRRKTPSPPHSQHQHQHQHQAQLLLQQHPALRSRASSNRSPSPTFSIDSLGEQLHPRMSTVSAISAISQRTMSPVTPPQGPQSDYFAIPMPRHRHDSPSARSRRDARAPSPQYPHAPRSDMLPAPLRTSTSSLGAPPPLHAAGFAPPPTSSPRNSTSSDRPPRPLPPQHFPSSEDVSHRRRHASGDYPRGVQQHGAEQRQQRTLGRRAASSEHLSPPRTRRQQRGPSPLRGHDRDRALPPLPAAAASPEQQQPQHQYAYQPSAPPDVYIQHANSAPPSALFLPDDARLPDNLQRASSLRATTTAAAPPNMTSTTAFHAQQPPPADDVDVTDVALFAEALQGLGAMTLDAPFEPGFAAPSSALPPAPATVIPPPPAPLENWSMPPPAARLPHPPPPSQPPAPQQHSTDRRTPQAQHHLSPQRPPPPHYSTPAAQPPTSRPAPQRSTATPRAFNAGWAEVELNEAVLGLPDQTSATARPPDDELPDYATSQREAAERSRRAALTRAQELESRWRGSAPFRSR